MVAAAKLGRRSHKMRELISEATRTVEDSQTAQALHGLLSLKSPADCPPTTTTDVLTSVSELAMEVIQQASSGLTEQSQAAVIHDVETVSNKSPIKSPSQPSTSSKSVDHHATLRAAILSPSGSGLQPASVGAAGSAVQILLQMQQDDASSPAAKCKPVRAKLASSVSAGNISVVPTTSSVGLNTTHMLLDTSVPVKIGAATSAAKATAVASAPLSSVIPVSDSSSGQAVPIRLIATSQGVLAIPQNCKLVAQNALTAASAVRVTQPALAAVASPAKRRLSAPASTGGLLKVAKLQTPVSKSQPTNDTSRSVAQSEQTVVVANSLPHTVNEGVLTDASLLLNHSLQTAIRDSYEKLFWKVYLQSSSFQSMPRPPVEGFSEVSLQP